MSKFKIIGLDKLRDHGVSTGNELITNVIDKFIEDSVIALLTEIDCEDYNIADNLEDDKDLDDTIWYSSVSLKDEVIVLVPSTDIYIIFTAEITGFYLSNGEYDYAEVDFSKIELQWLENSFNMIGTILNEILADKIIDCI